MLMAISLGVSARSGQGACVPDDKRIEAFTGKATAHLSAEDAAEGIVISDRILDGFQAAPSCLTVMA